MTKQQGRHDRVSGRYSSGGMFFPYVENMGSRERNPEDEGDEIYTAAFVP
jgi:hypothetical protein